jgi:hypothetical protein
MELQADPSALEERTASIYSPEVTTKKTNSDIITAVSTSDLAVVLIRWKRSDVSPSYLVHNGFVAYLRSYPTSSGVLFGGGGLGFEVLQENHEE